MTSARRIGYSAEQAEVLPLEVVPTRKLGRGRGEALAALLEGDDLRAPLIEQTMGSI